MHGASDRLQYLYGLGGLGDFQLTSSMVRAADARASRSVTRMFVTASGDPDPTNPRDQPDSRVAECDCALAEVQSAFSLDSGTIATMQDACYQDPSGFLVALQQQAAAQGVQLDTARCGSAGAWYKDPKKLGLAAIAGVGGAALLWAVFR